MLVYRRCKCALDVFTWVYIGKYTPNTAVTGEMGWSMPKVRIWKCIARAWCRMVNMDNDRINKKVFDWAKNNRQRNWCFRVSDMFIKIGSNELCNGFPIAKPKLAIGGVTKALVLTGTTQWKSELNRISGKRIGANKLRTYRKFKNDLTTSHYLKINMPRAYRSAYAKFRCGVAPIRLETGRYERLEVNNRLCPLCEEDVEDEYHVLLKCKFHQEQRDYLIHVFNENNIDFNGMNDDAKLITILNNEKCIVPCAKTCYNILQNRTKIIYKL